MYIVMEVQTNSDGTVGTLVNSYESERQAQNKYYTILAAAAVSSLPKHSAYILTDDGIMHSAYCFLHEGE